MDWNSAMSSVRVSVEWIFKDMSNYFKFLDFKNNFKVQLSAVEKMYIACTFKMLVAAYIVQQLPNILKSNHQHCKNSFCKQLTFLYHNCQFCTITRFKALHMIFFLLHSTLLHCTAPYSKVRKAVFCSFCSFIC